MIIVKGTTASTVPTPTLPRAPRYRPQGLTFLFTGADGSVWDLTHGPVRLQPGPSGLLPPDVEYRYSSSPVLAGASLQGSSTPVLPVTLPVIVQSGPDLVIRDLSEMLWRALVPNVECTLTVVSPDAVVRELPVWFVGAGGAGIDRDPLVMASVAHQLSFVAPDPYWRGPASSQRFEPFTPLPFFATSGAVFNLSPGQSTAESTVRNDGDVAAWPAYSVYGKVDSFSVGVGDSTIDYGPVSAGASVWVDTHPSRQTVGFASGENDETAWLNLTARTFAAIPAGAEVPITVTLDAPGVGAALVVELVPRYRRPW